MYLSSAFYWYAVFDKKKTFAKLDTRIKIVFLIDFCSLAIQELSGWKQWHQNRRKHVNTAICVHIDDALRATATDDHYWSYGQWSERGKAFSRQLLKSDNILLRRPKCSVSDHWQFVWKLLSCERWKDVDKNSTNKSVLRRPKTALFKCRDMRISWQCVASTKRVLVRDNR